MPFSEVSDPLARCVSHFPGCRVLVLGDAILDEYLLGDCNRISPEAPVPVLKVHSLRQELGGAANTAANIASLGGHATLISLVGTDTAGQTLKRRASELGIELMAVDHGLTTLRKTRVIGQHQQIVRLDYEEIPAPSLGVESEIESVFSAAIRECAIVVISDYAKGFLSRSLAHALIGRAHDAGRKVVVDPRPQHRDFYTGCDYLTPNWKESRALLHLPDAEATASETATTAAALARSLDANIVLTLGPQGIRFCSKSGDEQFAQPTKAREVFDVSGAGDTVAAAFALSLAAGADHASAVAIANRAASVVVGKFGTATVKPAEILDHGEPPRVVPYEGLAPLSARLRADGKRIVTVAGSFDILHRGHLHILTEARRAGDVLVVALRSDRAVRSLHGPNRPRTPERQRVDMLLSLRPVDHVHIFDDAEPLQFLKELNPHVHVEGTDHHGRYAALNAAVTAAGGQVQVVDTIESSAEAERSERAQPRV